MSGLVLRYLAFLGPARRPARVEFDKGLNVICGASETGKSFIVESIDFMLGGGDPPRDIPERAGYDRVRLSVESPGWPPLTLERSIEGGSFRAYEEELFDNEPSTQGTILRERHSGARRDTLSHALLERVGLTLRRLRKNRHGDTRSFSFRDLARLSVVNEEEIQRRSSPVVSTQYVQATSEYAAFKLLISGMDDSALVATADTPAKQQEVSGKIELLDEMIGALEGEITEDGIEKDELRYQLERLDASIMEQDVALDRVQTDLDDLLHQRGSVATEIRKRRARWSEIQYLTDRFRLLSEHYTSDLRRLEAIQESGSFFVHIERGICPLCGASRVDQHVSEHCDGNVEEVVQAAIVETQKIRRLALELNDTVESLNHEGGRLEEELPALERQYRTLDDALSEVARPQLATERVSYHELLTKKSELSAALDKFTRLDRLVVQRTELEEREDGADESREIRTMIPRGALDSFSQTVERILVEWHYPNASRVFFDEAKKDFQIAGKERGSTGKGLRAITHAAVSLAIMEFCLERDLPHPAFLVVDSPLLAYWKPEGEDDDLSGTDLKDRFYEYLLGTSSGTQIVVVENEHPPDFVTERGNVIVFTKNPHRGRYGFFPPPT